MTIRRAAACLAVGAGLAAWLGAPAAAHPVEAGLRTVLGEPVPPLPDGVTLSTRTGPAVSLELCRPDGPGPRAVQVLDATGEPYLSVTPDAVRLDLGRSAGRASLAAQPVAGEDLRGGVVTVGAGPCWSWSDHRLHPERLRVPAGGRAGTVVHSAELVLRLGGTDHRVPVRVEVAAGRGRHRVELDPLPATAQERLPGVTVTLAGSARLPGLFVANPQGARFAVRGPLGEEFARFGPRGLEVDEASATRVLDQRARGVVGLVPSATPRVVLLGGPGLTWLDARLRPPVEVPAEPRRAQDVAQVEVELVPSDGPPVLVTGRVRWEPAAQPADDVTGWPLVTALLAVVLAGAAVTVTARGRSGG